MAGALELGMEEAGILSKTRDLNRADRPLSEIPGVPLYVQIREALRERITQELLNPGQRIPSEEDLAGRYGVSRVTVRKAISDLIGDGLLYRSHGVGTFVANVRINRDHTRLTDFFEDAAAQGMGIQAQILSREIIPAEPKIAKALALPEGELVVRIESLRLVGGEPVTVHCAYVSQRIFPDLSEKELSLRSIWTFLGRDGFKVKYAIEKLEACLADRVSAHLLQIEEGSPILYKERIIFAEDGTPLEYQECHNRGDRYACTVVLRR